MTTPNQARPYPTGLSPDLTLGALALSVRPPEDPNLGNPQITTRLSNANPELGFLERPGVMGGNKFSICPAAMDSLSSLGEPKVSLPNGSSIYYWDAWRESSPADEFSQQPLGINGNPELDTTPNFRLIVARSPNGDTRYTVQGGSNDVLTNHGSVPSEFLQGLRLGVLKDPQGQDFLNQLGYLFVNGQTYAPSPETFKRFCANQGISVEIYSDRSRLGHEEYLGAFRRGAYPIGALDNFYSHDIQDDHITALLIGGPGLQGAIAESLNKASEVDPYNLAATLDIFTAAFRSVLLPNGSLQGDNFGKTNGRSTLKNIASTLGIDPDKVDELISTAQARIVNFGLTPSDID